MRVVISTGAGISKASGLPVYRGEGGLWTENPELEAKSSNAGVKNYLDELWAEWGPFREKMKTVHPNAAHLAIARLQLEHPDDVTVVTQNVDGLHQQALERLDDTAPPESYFAAHNKIYELHGNVWLDKCSNLECEESRTNWDSTYPGPGECQRCGAPTRPDMVLFSEMLPEYKWLKAQGACLMADLYVAVGTSGTVYPASELVTVTKKNGARTLLVNSEPWEYPHPDFDETIIGNAEDILSDILEREIGTSG